MAKGRYATNPAKVKVDIDALEARPPQEVFQRRVDLRRRLSVLLMCLLTTVLLGVSFAPFDHWYLAYFALVPWGLALAGAHGRWWLYFCVVLAGALFWAGNLYWLMWVTLEGYAGLVIYLTLYWLVAAVVVRASMRRNYPMWLVLPVVCVAMEYARAYVMSGFPWFYLAHTQYTQTRLIQVADVAGQYGVSFFVAMVNGVIVDVLNSRLFVRSRPGPRLTRQIFVGVAVVAVTLAGLLGYGTWRLSQETTSPGPVVGICQQAVPISLSGISISQQKIFSDHYEGSKKFKGTGCELVMWPETMLPGGLNAEMLDRLAAAGATNAYGLRGYAAQMEQLSKDLDAVILAGGSSIHEDTSSTEDDAPPLSRNSALWFDRSWRPSGEYSKRHLVPFSEYVPFKESWPWLHEVLRSFVPELMPQLDPGDAYTRFRLVGRGPDKPEWVIAVPICYEGTFPRICRDMVIERGVKKVHVLANISNDGWFYWQWAEHCSTENAQHLSHYCFRAIENRVPVVRSVNTGISGSIDSNGRIQAVVQRWGQRQMLPGQLLLEGRGEEDRKETDALGLQRGPQVLVDSRVSVYSLVGDVFAQAVSVAAGVLVLVLRKRVRKDKKHEGVS